MQRNEVRLLDQRCSGDLLGRERGGEVVEEGLTEVGGQMTDVRQGFVRRGLGRTQGSGAGGAHPVERSKARAAAPDFHPTPIPRGHPTRYGAMRGNASDDPPTTPIYEVRGPPETAIPYINLYEVG
jgi:hypothetical protein